VARTQDRRTIMLKLYTIPDVANILQISERTVYEYIYNGSIKAAKVANRWRIKPEWLDDFIEHQEKIQRREGLR
jgi:excisionase family DNA binding protein